MSEVCYTCRFFVPIITNVPVEDRAKTGSCFLNPPTVLDSEGYIQSEHPTVVANWFCSKWSKKT